MGDEWLGALKGSLMRRGRREILEEHGLSIAPSEAQRFFWERYNKSRRRPATQVGELLERIETPRLAESADVLGRIRAAWRAIMPEVFSGRTYVEGLRGGTLRVVVASSADRFTLSRQMPNSLIEALNESARGNLVKRIEYRVGALPRAKKTEETIE
ncbi:MAG: DUF721 domain-containing protein [Planctomycetes bacterium]|nr:DUF721 domain-containing protein [Planctomycetota bacterium]